MRSKSGDLICFNTETGEVRTFDYRGPPPDRGWKVIEDITALDWVNLVRASKHLEPYKDLEGYHES